MPISMRLAPLPAVMMTMHPGTGSASCAPQASQAIASMQPTGGVRPSWIAAHASRDGFQERAEASADRAVELLERLEETCSLDVADRGEHTLDEIGQVMRVSKERVRTIEADGLSVLRRRRMPREEGSP